MISLTLQFDTMDAAIDALTAMHVRNTISASVPALGTVKPKEGTTEGKSAKAPAPTPAASAPAPAPAAAPAAASASPSDAVDPVTYPDLQKAVMALYTKDKKAPAAVAAEMGVDHFNKLKPEQYAAALAKVKAKTAELSK